MEAQNKLTKTGSQSCALFLNKLSANDINYTLSLSCFQAETTCFK